MLLSSNPRSGDALSARRGGVFDDDRIKVFTRCWIVLTFVYCCIDFPRQLADGYTNGAGRPFGDDYVNYWSAAYLALHGRAYEIYLWDAFHAFQQSIVGQALDNYHYSYPPVMLLLTAPLGLLPYIWGWIAWTLLGWLAFYRALLLTGGRYIVLALATPPLFYNTLAGQNGTWTAALLGGGLALVDRRPKLAGVLFGLLIYKPHLGLLLPIALVAGRRWQAFVCAAITAIGLIGLSVVVFGIDVWQAYLFNLSQLRVVILEDGTGVWHRMMSIFVAARRLGADVPLAYIIQASFGGVAAVAVAWSWWTKSCSSGLRNALVILGTCLTTPYLQDYDFVFAAFVAVWLYDLAEKYSATTLCKASIAMLFVGPIISAPLGGTTGLAFGPLFFIPAFVLALAFLVRARNESAGTDETFSSDR